jgi:hypothetical protein
MRLCHAILWSIVAVLTACRVIAQTPVLGSVEAAPYAALQSQVRIAGGS